MEDFGSQVRQRRKEESLSQKDLAEKAGLSRTYLSEIERGEAQNISFQVVEKLQKILGIGKETDSSGDLPSGLSEFADEENLPSGDVEALRSIEMRGKRPESKQEWRVLYNLIRSYLDSKD